LSRWAQGPGVLFYQMTGIFKAQDHADSKDNFFPAIVLMQGDRRDEWANEKRATARPPLR
jgi:hypothetical protein